MIARGVCTLALLASAGMQQAEQRATVVLVVGAEGAPEYAEEFALQAERWEQAAAAGGAQVLRVGVGAPQVEGREDRAHFRETLAALEPDGAQPVWLVLIGHGTHDRAHAKFNLRGPDPTAEELAEWLAPIRRPTAIALCFSTSGAFVPLLSRAGRVVVSATRSGAEYNYARFGGPLSRALLDPAADLDKDEQVSLLEAWLFAAAAVAEFYAGESRLATEHALLDDDGDGLGTPASWFRGVRATKSAVEGALPDGLLAHRLHLVPSARERAWPPELRAERDALERAIEELRARKSTLAEDDYYAELETLLLPLARLHARIDGD